MDICSSVDGWHKNRLHPDRPTVIDVEGNRRRLAEVGAPPQRGPKNDRNEE